MTVASATIGTFVSTLIRCHDTSVAVPVQASRIVQRIKEMMRPIGALAEAVARRPAALALMMLVIPSWGCGHEATREECEVILAKNAEFELRAQGISNGDEIQRRVSETKAARPELLDACVGKRITDEAMQCVRDAADADAFEACLE